MLRVLTILVLFFLGCGHEHDVKGLDCEGWEVVDDSQGSGSGNSGSGGGGDYSCGGRGCGNVPMQWGYNDPQFDSFCAVATQYSCACMEEARRQTCSTLIQFEIEVSTPPVYSGQCPICTLADVQQ